MRPHRPLIATFILLAIAARLAQPATPTQPNQNDWTPLTYSTTNKALLENPLKGLLPWAPSTAKFPHSMEWFYMRLNDVVKGDKIYDWTPLEKQLKDIASRGNQAIFRFYVDYPGKPSAIPQYLLDAGLKTFPYTDSNNTISVSPDYTDPRLIAAFDDFIAAMGAKYDGDPRIAFIQAGLYGFWGEFHVHNHPTAGEPAGWKIATRDKDGLLQAYIKAFPKTLIQLRYADATADKKLQLAFGYHDDSIGNDTISERKSDFWTRMTAEGLQEIWKTRPIGGEMYPALNKTLWDIYPKSDVQNVEDCIKTTHMSWMSNSAAFSNNLTPDQRTRALAAHQLMGYQLFVSAAHIARDEKNEGNVAKVEVEVENRGIAPFYYNWTIELALAGADKQIMKPVATIWKLTTVLPEKKVRWEMKLDINDANGMSVLMRVVNPLPNGKPVVFANAEQDQTLPGWLTLGSIHK